MMRNLVSVAVCSVFAQAPALAQYEVPTATTIHAPADTTQSGNAKLQRAYELETLLLGEPGDLSARNTNTRLAHPSATPPQVHRALFCRLDDDLDERRISLRMRLGDLETVNRKEAKPGW